MLIKHTEETTISFTLEEMMPMLLDALKRHKKIEFHNIEPSLRIKKKSSTLNDPDTIEFIYIKHNEHDDDESIEITHPMDDDHDTENVGDIEVLNPIKCDGCGKRTSDYKKGEFLCPKCR